MSRIPAYQKAKGLDPKQHRSNGQHHRSEAEKVLSGSGNALVGAKRHIALQVGPLEVGHLEKQKNELFGGKKDKCEKKYCQLL